MHGAWNQFANHSFIFSGSLSLRRISKMSKMGTINSDTDPDTITILHRRGPAQRTLRTAAVSLFLC